MKLILFSTNLPVRGPYNKTKETKQHSLLSPTYLTLSLADSGLQRLPFSATYISLSVWPPHREHSQRQTHQAESLGACSTGWPHCPTKHMTGIHQPNDESVHTHVYTRSCVSGGHVLTQTLNTVSTHYGQCNFQC